METVLRLTIPHRLRIPCERIIRGCLVLIMFDMLYWGVQNYAVNSAAESQDSAAKSQSREGIFAISMVSADDFEHNLKRMTGLPDLENMNLPVTLPAAVNNPSDNKVVNNIVTADIDHIGDSSPIVSTEPKTDSNSIIGKDDIADDILIPDVDVTEPDNPFTEKTDPDSPAVDKDSSNVDAGSEIDTIKEFYGFTVDEEGYITGITNNIDTTDGILVIAWDPECTGIRNGALSEVLGCLEEIYIPANICDIESDTLEELSSYMIYIEVAEDNPHYYSINGEIYLK